MSSDPEIFRESYKRGTEGKATPQHVLQAIRATDQEARTAQRGWEAGVRDRATLKREDAGSESNDRSESSETDPSSLEGLGERMGVVLNIPFIITGALGCGYMGYQVFGAVGAVIAGVLGALLGAFLALSMVVIVPGLCFLFFYSLFFGVLAGLFWIAGWIVNVWAARI